MKAIFQEIGGNLKLNGLDVYHFGSSEVPKNVNQLLEETSTPKDAIDYFVFHQANLLLNESIRRKLKIDAKKVPYSLKNYGNTSCASIPLTLVSQLSSELKNQKNTFLLSGFGVGLAWASVIVNISDIVCPELIELK